MGNNRTHTVVVMFHVARLKNTAGISALPTVLLIAAILIELAVVGAALAYAIVNTRLSERLAAEALGAARAGAQDAILKVIREGGCPTSLPVLTVGQRTAERTCTENTPGTDQITVTSIGKALSRQKKVQVILGVDPTTGEVKLQSFLEVAI